MSKYDVMIFIKYFCILENNNKVNYKWQEKWNICDSIIQVNLKKSVVVGWMDRWIIGGKSHFENCLKQSKRGRFCLKWDRS